MTFNVNNSTNNIFSSSQDQSQTNLLEDNKLPSVEKESDSKKNSKPEVTETDDKSESHTRSNSEVIKPYNFKDLKNQA